MAKRATDVYGGQDPRILAAYTVTEGAHHLQLPAATVRSWVLGRSYPTRAGDRRFKPLTIIADPKGRLLSFQNLVEIHVLGALRREHLVRLAAVREAVAYLRREFGTRHPLADHQMLTDGKDLFVKRYGQLINASREGQLALLEVLERYLARVERDPRGAPIRLYPFAGLREDEAKPVVIDPRVEFGRPCLAGAGVPTSIVAERCKAGESIAALAHDYGMEPKQIEGALRYELRLAA